MKTPLLTVITPVYNGQRFIGSCLRSVIDQNYPHVEHLIMDGGSTDMTLDIIKRYAKSYPHIRWISEMGCGQSASMNKGIALARGEIIGILNCDDYYGPDVLSRILKIFETMPDPGFVVGNCNVLNDDEKVISVNKPSRLNLTDLLIGGEKNQHPYNPSAYFYHRSLHEKIGLYDESDHYTMDLDFLLRAVSAAHIKYVDETWGNYRYIRGTKTFRSKENNKLEANKMRVMDVYLDKLPLFQRCWIRMVRFMLVQRQVPYYVGRTGDYLRDPKLIRIFILKKLHVGFPSFSGTERRTYEKVHSNAISHDVIVWPFNEGL